MATLGQLLGEHTYLKLQPNNKIICDVTGHEMSARADVVQSYISGKKFKKELEWYRHDYSEFLPHIVEDKRNSKQLYCKVTKQALNRIPEEVRKHMQGKRFQKLLAEQQQERAVKEKRAAVKSAKAQAYADRKAAEDQEESSDDEEIFDPAMMKAILGGSGDEAEEMDEEEDEEEQEAPAARRVKIKAPAVTPRPKFKENDDMTDLLGDDSNAEDGEAGEGEDAEGDEEEGSDFDEDEEMEGEQDQGRDESSDDERHPQPLRKKKHSRFPKRQEGGNRGKGKPQVKNNQKVAKSAGGKQKQSGGKPSNAAGKGKVAKKGK